MKINLRDLTVSVADPSPYVRRMLIGMLRGFGASKIYERDTSEGLITLLDRRSIDLLVCDLDLPGIGGVEIVKKIRADKEGEHRTIPIILITMDTRQGVIKAAQDSGANMIIEKPFSPKTLYERISWMAVNERPFVETPNYFGPDRRTKFEGPADGIERRATVQSPIDFKPSATAADPNEESQSHRLPERGRALDAVIVA